MAKIVSIQIGLPRLIGDIESTDPIDEPWTSGFFKTPVDGAVRVDSETIVGDGVADRVNHGGPDKALLGYAADHYPEWKRELKRNDMAGGAFGENLTIAGQTEADVCVGDVYQLGEVVLEVSQPRQPCWKLGRRWRMKDLPGRVIANGRTGWYFRVLQTGTLRAGQSVELRSRGFPGLTIQALNDMLYGRRPVTPAAIECPALSQGWRRTLGAK